MGCELALMVQFELESDLYIDVDIGAGEETATIAAGYYDSMIDFVAAVEAALILLDATFVAVIGDGASQGKPIISRTGSFDILWNTGTNAAESIGLLLGFDVTADDTGAASYTADHQHQHGWYSPIGPASDSYDRPQSMGPAPFVAMSSRLERISWATHYIREWKFQTIPADLFFESDADLNEDFETFWIKIAEGWPFHVFEDLDQASTLWVDLGQYALETDENPDLLANVPRLDPGTAFYSVTLAARKRNP